jgi:ArsR family transcriptional regulator
MKARPSSYYERRADVIKSLAHPSRVLIAEALTDGEMCVCELTDLIGADMSTVSKHLAVMKNVGLVQMEKRGQNVYYRIACPCLTDFFRCVDTIQRNRAKQLHAACC